MPKSVELDGVSEVNVQVNALKKHMDAHEEQAVEVKLDGFRVHADYSRGEYYWYLEFQLRSLA